MVWLLRENAAAERTSAEKAQFAASTRRVSSSQIELALPEHLARHRLADLFARHASQ